MIEQFLKLLLYSYSCRLKLLQIYLVLEEFAILRALRQPIISIFNHNPFSSSRYIVDRLRNDCQFYYLESHVCEQRNVSFNTIKFASISTE